MAVNIPSQIVIQTAAQWALDTTVYSKRILVTSDVKYTGFDIAKFKIADGVQQWSGLDYFPDPVITGNTGLLYGGAVSGLGTSTATYTAGVGAILNNSNPMAETFGNIIWSGGSFTSLSNGLYYIYVDSTSTVQITTTAPSHAEYRLYIWLARVSVTSGSISAINPIPMPIQQYGPGLWDIWRALGLVKRDLSLSANGANLKLNIGDGEIYQPGANLQNDATNPHEVSFTAQSAFTFRMATGSGTIASDVTDLPVGSYAPSGTVISIPGGANTSTIFTVFRFPQGNIRILYGQTTYTSLANAQSAIGTYSPVLPAGYNEAIILGYIAVTKGATALNSSSQAVILNTNKFGGIGGGVGGALGNYLQIGNNLSELAATASTARDNISAERKSTQAVISASDVDWSAATHFYKTLSANLTITFSNDTDAQTIIIKLIQGASAYTVTWPSGVQWANTTEPTMSTTAGRHDIYTLVKINGVISGSYVQNLG